MVLIELIVSIYNIYMPPSICSNCGNCHFGPCATEETCFIWTPEGKDIPNEVGISGSWKKWQIVQHLNKEVKETGEVYFRINLTLLAGIYDYKYIVDGQWKCDPKAPIVDDGQGNVNNSITVYPKKMFIPVNKDGEIKISSCIMIEGLQLIGSWNNWTTVIPMVKMQNHLKGCDEFVAFVQVEPDKEYEFKFKYKKQYLIDEKYPTIVNEFNTQNNVIITYSQVDNVSTEKMETPNKWHSYKHLNTIKDFSCKSFEWVTVTRTFDLPYKRVEGHTMCCIGDYIYIFGGNYCVNQVQFYLDRQNYNEIGYCRSEFYNSLTKINIQLTSARSEEALPNGRAYHNLVTYGNKIIIFGGHSKTVLDDYYTFNVSEQKWMAVPHISGKYPEKKEKQSCVIYEMLMVFFGGYFFSPDFEYEAYYNTISVLDIENMKWIDQISVQGEQPAGRFAHTASLIGSDMYVFGGTYNTAENLNLNDIWKINLSIDSELAWVQLSPKGIKPAARHGHSMNVLHNYLIVFGGQNNDGVCLNDVFIFNTAQNQWFEPLITGEVPRPRYYHASTVIQNDQLVVFGGRTKMQNAIESIYILKPAENKITLNIEEENDQ